MSPGPGQSRTTFGLIAVTATLTVLLFVGGPDPWAPRSVHRLWDLGHLPLFFCATLLVLRTRVGRWRVAAQVSAILVGAAALGAATEFLQAGFQRIPARGDLLRDILGVCLALAFTSPTAASLRPGLRKTVRLAVLGWLTFVLLPATGALLDEHLAKHQFPVLADFETPLEVGRWSGDATFDVVGDLAGRQGRSLRIQLGTETYSGVVLAHFPGDWSGFRVLAFSMLNPEDNPIRLVCKVHDREHRRRDYAYGDRFNRRIELAPGWNELEIPLSEIRAAPRDREMDLGNIGHLAWFAVQLPRPRVVYLDGVELRR